SHAGGTEAAASADVAEAGPRDLISGAISDLTKDPGSLVEALDDLGAAAAFPGDSREATLGAFLAYLEAAESEEFGLEAGQVGETDSVKLATVHAAKGLQWAAV